MGAKVVNKNGYFNFGGVQKLYTKGAKVVYKMKNIGAITEYTPASNSLYRVQKL